MGFELAPDNRDEADVALLDDLRLVSTKLQVKNITREAYADISRFSPATVAARFGGWGRALELGFVPFDRVGGELLFNLLTGRYERRATVVTTNLAFAERVTDFACDEKLTTALLDCLAHHATVLTTKGKSYRLRTRRGADGRA